MSEFGHADPWQGGLDGSDEAAIERAQSRSITQQLKERVKDHLLMSDLPLDDINPVLRLLETTITELIEHIEGEIGDKEDVYADAHMASSNERYWQGYNAMHFKVLSLLSDIKSNV